MVTSFPPTSCTGCTACANVCPKGCITMQENSKGFFYPVIERSLCVDCGACSKACPVLHANKNSNIVDLFLAKHRDENIRLSSSSGGFFTAIASCVINQHGVVFGAAFDDQWNVVHDFTDTIDGLARFRGSKYVQSRLGDTFIKVKDFLDNDRMVLFTGTPCQVAGLLRFLKKPYKNLITVDIICHGVPSEKVWQKYLHDELSHRCQRESNQQLLTHNHPRSDKACQVESIQEIRFRDKSNGWKNFSFVISLSSDAKSNNYKPISLSVNAWEHPFMKGFLYNLFLRASCYHCPVKNFSSNSDLTMADGWGIENYLPEWDDDKGASLIICHSAKASDIVNKIQDIKLHPVDASILTRHNEAAFQSPIPNRHLNKFYRLTNKHTLSFHEVIRQCFPPSNYFDKLRWSINKRFDKLKKRKQGCKKILIIGTGSLLNYGCEAIIQGTYTILKTIFPNCEITVASDNHNYDREILPKDIKLISYKRRFSAYRIYRGILRRLFHIGQGSEVRMKTNIAKRFDLVLSAGGDNYCETPEGNIYNLLVDLMEVGYVAINNGRKYILWGASVGPFKNEDNLERVTANLHKCSLITVREELSFHYVKEELQCPQAVLVADPAFCMDPDMSINFSKEEGFIYIGLNLSELSVAHCISADKRSGFIKALFEQLDSILESNPKFRFVCIPHVMTDVGVQNDIIFMNKYIKSTNYPDKVSILPENLGARKTKAIISCMDLLVASRMHCCVGGISTSTPTLFIHYSNKGIGMSGYAYGHHKYELSVDSLTSSAFPSLVKRMIVEGPEIKHYLQNQQERFTADAMKAGNSLIQFFV